MLVNGLDIRLSLHKSRRLYKTVSVVVVAIEFVVVFVDAAAILLLLS